MSITIWIRPDFFVLVDEQDAHLLSAMRYRPNNGYACRVGSKSESRSCYLHRDILGASQGEMVDHVNRVKHDCRRSNLRLVSRVENGWNQNPRRGKRCDYKGVILLATPRDAWRFYPIGKSRNRFAARIADADGRTVHLGVFATQIDAARAYDRACLAMRGEFAVLNFPDVEQQHAA